MGYFSKFLGISAVLMLLSVSAYAGEERDPLKARVPADQMADARAAKNPVASSPETLAKGKALYEGKGTCFNCHGKEGDGMGEAGKILNPAPRNFTNCKFHKKRKDGELFWVIKNGIKMTGMPAWADHSDEEIWATVAFLKKLPSLTPQDYAKLIMARMKHGGHPHPATEPGGAAASPPHEPPHRH